MGTRDQQAAGDDPGTLSDASAARYLMSAERKRGDNLALVREDADVGQSRGDDVAALDTREIAFVEEWALASPHNPYRNYRLISRPQASQVLAAAVLEPGPQVMRLWHRDGTEPKGLIRVEPLPWDSALYELEMGRITHICGNLSPGKIRALLDQTSFDHLAVRVDASNTDLQRALTEAGFFPVDSVLKFLHDPSRGAPPEPAARRSRTRNTFRKYEPRDRDDVLRLTADTFVRYPGRYHADPWLRPKGTQRYVGWAEKYVDGEADTIWVSESHGRVVAYLAFRYNRTLFRVLGLGCYGAGLGASRGGDYQSLCRHALMFTTDIAWQVAEFDTQIDNYHVHRIYRDLKFDYAYAEHTYHLHRT